MIAPRHELNAALITSFNPNISVASPDFVHSAEQSQMCWPRGDYGSLGVDLYLMMESDVKRWVEKLGVALPHVSAFNFLRSLSAEHCCVIARSLCQNAQYIGSPIIALTSFLPEINLSADDWRGKNCSQVLESLVRIAAEIALATGQTPVIQLVAGSLISGFTTLDDERLGKRVLYARRGDESLLMTKVLERIAEALHTVAVEYHGKLNFQSCMRIAFELEPGPLYLLRDSATLIGFRKAIEDLREPIVDACVGYNLDVAHWWLAERINTKWLAANPRVAERVYHAHISGHSPRGHFGDIPLGRLDSQMVAPFKRWLSEIARLPNVQYVSLEMEAARSMADVEQSVLTLRQWLDNLDDPQLD